MRYDSQEQLRRSLDAMYDFLQAAAESCQRVQFAAMGSHDGPLTVVGVVAMEGVVTRVWILLSPALCQASISIVKLPSATVDFKQSRSSSRHLS